MPFSTALEVFSTDFRAMVSMTEQIPLEDALSPARLNFLRAILGLFLLPACGVLSLLLSGCGSSPPLPRRLHLIDLGFPMEARDALFTPDIVKREGRQFRSVVFHGHGSLLIRNIPWPGQGSLRLQVAPAEDPAPSGSATFEAALMRRGELIHKLSFRLDASEAATTTAFTERRLAWSGLRAGPVDLRLRLVPDKDFFGAWLCDGGVLEHEEPFHRLDRPGKDRPNLVLVLIDTLRADHLGCYGYDRDTSPVMDGLAQEGLLFTRLRAQSSWTKPSTATILSGLPSYDHGAVTRSDLLPDRVWTLSEELQNKGYQTCAFIGNGWIGNPHFNFNQGYDHFIKVEGEDSFVRGRAGEILQRGIEWLSLNGSKPFFLFLHLIDPHDPYTPPADLKAQFDRGRQGDVSPASMGENGFNTRPLSAEELGILVDLYDGEIAEVDRALGSFLKGLDALGIRDDTVLLVTSDHGEEFLEHGGMVHGRTLYEEQLRVPLIAAGPGVLKKGTAFDRLVRHMDIAPMALGLLGLPPSAAFAGEDPLAPGARPIIFAEADLENQEFRSLSVLAGEMKLIQDYAPDESLELFNLAEDPEEKRNLAPEGLDQAKPLLNRVKSQEARIIHPGLYIACRGDGKIKRFEIMIGGARLLDECLFRMCEENDSMRLFTEEQRTRFVFEMDTPQDIDLVQIVSELEKEKDYWVTIQADHEKLDPQRVYLGRDGKRSQSLPMKAPNGFAEAASSPLPPIDLGKFLEPGCVAIFKVEESAARPIPEKDIEDLRGLGYF